MLGRFWHIFFILAVAAPVFAQNPEETPWNHGYTVFSEKPDQTLLLKGQRDRYFLVSLKNNKIQIQTTVEGDLQFQDQPLTDRGSDFTKVERIAFQPLFGDKWIVLVTAYRGEQFGLWGLVPSVDRLTLLSYQPLVEVTNPVSNSLETLPDDTGGFYSLGYGLEELVWGYWTPAEGRRFQKSHPWNGSLRDIQSFNPTTYPRVGLRGAGLVQKDGHTQLLSWQWSEGAVTSLGTQALNGFQPEAPYVLKSSDQDTGVVLHQGPRFWYGEWTANVLSHSRSGTFESTLTDMVCSPGGKALWGWTLSPSQISFSFMADKPTASSYYLQGYQNLEVLGTPEYAGPGRRFIWLADHGPEKTGLVKVTAQASGAVEVLSFGRLPSVLRGGSILNLKDRVYFQGRTSETAPLTWWLLKENGEPETSPNPLPPSSPGLVKALGGYYLVSGGEPAVLSNF